MAYPFTRQEPVALIARIDGSDVVITGLEPTKCHVKKAGPNGAPPPLASLPDLVLTGVFTDAPGAEPNYWTFSGPSAALLEGNYVCDGWVQLSGTWVFLFSCTLKVSGAVTEVS